MVRFQILTVFVFEDWSVIFTVGKDETVAIFVRALYEKLSRLRAGARQARHRGTTLKEL